MRSPVETTSVSLSEVHKSVHVPAQGGAKSFIRRLMAFGGPAYLVSVGYMDPGNWATDLEGGARFGYDLIWVLVMSNLMAILLQTLSARLGIVTGRDLAQSCRDQYPKPIAFALWILCEIAIAACDLAEVLGTAIALNLLFGIPLLYGVLITALDVLMLLALQRLGMRKLEAMILTLVLLIGGCFVMEMFFAKPDLVGIAKGFSPKLTSESLFVAIGILGATVMPHNLYLHSALVQTRRFDHSVEGKREACKFNLFDSAIALNGALFINGAILILAAAVFHSRGQVVNEIQEAHRLLSPMLGTTLASTLFAVALLASGQSSTITGTLAGQIVMEGFLHLKIRPFFRRLLTRSIAIVPAALVIWLAGEDSSLSLLILSQVILSMQLAFAVIPLVHFTSDKNLMGEFANKTWVVILAWLTAIIVVSLNTKLLIDKEIEALESTGAIHTIGLIALPLLGALGLLLLYVSFKPLFDKRRIAPTTSPLLLGGDDSLIEAAAFRVIGVALDRTEHDRPVLRRAIAIANQGGPNAEIVLIHIAESAQTSVFGKDSADTTTVQGKAYLDDLEKWLAQATDARIKSILGYGAPEKQLVELVEREGIEVLVMGAHGHRGLKDLILGATISKVRHALKIPVLVVR
jgi:manganese transport protein